MVAVLKTTPARFLAYRIWDQWSWRQRFCADLSVRVRMMWRSLVQSFGGCNDQPSQTHNWWACVVWREGWQNWIIVTFELSAWDMGNFICFERHLEEHGISIRFDLQKVARRVYTDDLGWSDGRTWHSLIYRCINSEALHVAEGRKEGNWFLFTQERRPELGPRPTCALTVRNLRKWTLAQQNHRSYKLLG